jgi:hypothetical protein
MKKATRFEQGYICAVSTIFHGHGGGVHIDEALRVIGAKEIDPKSVDDFDRPMLEQFQKTGATI